MHLKRPQLIALISAVLIVCLLTYMGFKSGVSSTDPDAVKVAGEVDLNALVAEEVSKLPEQLKLRVKEAGKDQAGLQKTIVLWDSLGKMLPSAWYMWELAELVPEESNWLLAGSKYYNLAVMSNDTNLFAAAGKRAKEAFEKALQVNPNSLPAKNSLAACYVDFDRDIMKGVGLLKQVIAVDSNNLQALFTLGMLSVQSGQLDKARQRFERLVALQPFNPEYYYYLGEVYAKSGEVSEAIASYEKCKTLLNDTEAKKEVETIINKLKTI